MRFSSCKIHCPFICFCKPSPHICTSGPLKWQNAPQLPSTVVSVSNASDQSPAETTGVRDDSSVVSKKTGECFKSSLKRAPSEPNGQQRKQVQWTDFLGKELVEIREYESRWVNSSLLIFSSLTGYDACFNQYIFFSQGLCRSDSEVICMEI